MKKIKLPKSQMFVLEKYGLIFVGNLEDYDIDNNMIFLDDNYEEFKIKKFRWHLTVNPHKIQILFDKSYLPKGDLRLMEN